MQTLASATAFPSFPSLSAANERVNSSPPLPHIPKYCCVYPACWLLNQRCNKEQIIWTNEDTLVRTRLCYYAFDFTDFYSAAPFILECWGNETLFTRLCYERYWVPHGAGRWETRLRLVRRGNGSSLECILSTRVWMGKWPDGMFKYPVGLDNASFAWAIWIPCYLIFMTCNLTVSVRRGWDGETL